MSRGKIFLIIIVIILLILGGLIGFYYYLNGKLPAIGTEKGVVEDFKDFFSMGPRAIPSSPTDPDTNATTTTPDTLPDNQNTSLQGDGSMPVLRQISAVPVAGGAFVDKVIISTSTATTTRSGKVVTVIIQRSDVKSFIRYMERSNGNIHETATSTFNTTRLSNVTFPKVYNALFDASGDSIIAQTIPNESSDVVNTYYAHINKQFVGTSTTPVATSTLSTTLLSSTIDKVLLSPTRDTFFSLVKSTEGSQGSTSNLDASKKNIVWNSPLKEWQVSWPNVNTVSLTTKPSTGIVGYSYLLNLRNKVVTKLVGGIEGLTTLLSPDLSYVLLGANNKDKNSVELSVLNTKNNTTRALFIKTLPEKCAWSERYVGTVYCAVPESIPLNTYPDAWYQGTVSFSDSIWSIDLASGEARQIANLPKLTRNPIDAINLSVNGPGDYLLLTNKKDLTLWGLKIPPPVTSVATSTATSTSSR